MRPFKAMSATCLEARSGVSKTFPRSFWMCVFVCIFVDVSSTGFKTGSLCLRTRDNATGVCRPVSECPEARPKPGFKGHEPHICGIKKQITIVCCVTKEQLSPEQVVALSLNSATTNYIAKSVPVSQKKCKEYSRLAYEKIYDDNGNDNGERDRCVRPADPVKPGAALLGEFPFMALLLQKNADEKTTDHICGGTLISERYVLTSAVCVSHVPKFAGLDQVLSVLLGAVILNDQAEKAFTQVIPVVQTIIHPDFDLSVSYNDIALLFLKHRAPLSHRLRPVCLPHGDSLNAESFTATGWGFRSSAQLELESRLLKVNLVKAPFVICEKYWPAGEDRLPFGIHRPSQICAGHPYRKNGVCNGDGGGPLLARSSGDYCVYDIVGIVSFGASTCGSGEPDVFTRVAYFTRWIENIIWS